MIPLRDTTKSGTFPIVNTAFIAINIAVFIFVWFLIQFLGGISSVGRASDVGGVAFWAHLGGFAAGLILARHFDKQKYYSQKSFNGYYKN